MSHMVETMAYAGEVPWHGLGVSVPGDLSPEQMLEVAGLDWGVEKRVLTYQTANGQVKAPGKQALVRTSDDTLLDVVGEDWEPLTNIDAFTFFNDFCATGDMTMETAGSLDQGRRVWALAKVQDAFEIFKGDVIEQYLLLSNPHKYGMSIDVRMTPIRVVCNNTITMALGKNSDRMVKVNHRQVFDADYVKETLGVAKEKLDKYKEAASFLGAKKYKNEDVIEYFERIFPSLTKKDEKKVSRNARTAMEIIDVQPGAEFGEGTWWSAFNTITYMTDHLIGRNADTRLNSAWFGYNRKRKAEALEWALEYADAA